MVFRHTIIAILIFIKVKPIIMLRDEHQKDMFVTYYFYENKFELISVDQSTLYLLVNIEITLKGNFCI